MLDFKFVNVDEIPYLYQERSCSMDPAEIGPAMGQVFQAVWDYMTEEGVPSTGKAMSVYYTFDPERMTFRSGFSVNPDAESKAGDDVFFARTPAGKVLHFQHKGPYDKLRDSYGQMMVYAQKEGLEIGAPTWEIYVNDPATTPEEDLLTEVYVSLVE